MPREATLYGRGGSKTRIKYFNDGIVPPVDFMRMDIPTFTEVGFNYSSISNVDVLFLNVLTGSVDVTIKLKGLTPVETRYHHRSNNPFYIFDPSETHRVDLTRLLKPGLYYMTILNERKEAIYIRMYYKEK
jgi:hypothetical protein